MGGGTPRQSTPDRFFQGPWLKDNTSGALKSGIATSQRFNDRRVGTGPFPAVEHSCMSLAPIEEKMPPCIAEVGNIMR
jgi:hypothetical protein